ncbi:MAG: Crp/Fnr family transcriptional regulator [Bacteroidota bacterium]
MPTIDESHFEQFLQHLHRQVHLTDAEIALLRDRLKLRTYLKGQYILQEGDVYLYQTFVLSGRVRTFYLDGSGNEHVVAFGIENWWVGDICSFANQEPAAYNTQCLETTRVIQIGFEDMEHLFTTIPKLERYFRLIIQKAYGNMSKRLLNNHSMVAKERYLLFREHYPQFVDRYPAYMIASYLGITKEFLSSIRKEVMVEEKS